MSDNYTINDDGATNRPGNHGRTLKPDNDLVWSIICVSVCLPFGSLALIESVKVDSLFSNGQYDEAVEHQKAQRNGRSGTCGHGSFSLVL